MNNPKNLSDIFGRFFFMVGYLPALLLLTLVRWLIIPGLPAEIQQQYSLLNDTGYISEITLLLIIPVIFAALLISASNVIVQLYSGRPLLRPGKLPSKIYRKKHDEFRTLVKQVNERIPSLKKANNNIDDKLEDKIHEEASELQILIVDLKKITGGVLFLKSTALHTTRLGNVLASLSEYPDRRFGMNAGTIWPRLRAILPKEFDERLKSQNTNFMFELNLSTCCLLFTLLWVLFGVSSLAGWSRVNLYTWVIVFTTTCAGFYLFYRAAIADAVILVETMMTAFDLFRGSLLEKFGHNIPPTIAEEKKLWRHLTSFLLIGDEDLIPSRESLEGKGASKK